MILKQSDSDVGQRQESTVASSSQARDAECFTKVPKDMKALEPVIGMLIDKVGHRAMLFALADDVQNPPKGVPLNGAQRQERWLYHFMSTK